MELQTLFNISVQAIYRQGRASIAERTDGETPDCMYRAADGAKCAVGHLISNKWYTRDLEGHTADAEHVIEAIMDTWGMTCMDSSKTEVLNRLQGLHDLYLLERGLHIWAKFVVNLGETHGLIVPKQIRECADTPEQVSL